MCFVRDNAAFVIRVSAYGMQMISFPCLPMQLLPLLSYDGISNPVLHLQK